MPVDVKKKLDHYGRLKSGRGVWDNYFQQLAEVLHPKRADFTVSAPDGGKRTDKLYDGTPMRARRDLAATVDGLIKSNQSKWFTGGAGDEDLNDLDEVKR